MGGMSASAPSAPSAPSSQVGMEFKGSCKDIFSSWIIIYVYMYRYIQVQHNYHEFYCKDIVLTTCTTFKAILVISINQGSAVLHIFARRRHQPPWLWRPSCFNNSTQMAFLQGDPSQERFRQAMCKEKGYYMFDGPMVFVHNVQHEINDGLYNLWYW